MDSSGILARVKFPLAGYLGVLFGPEFGRLAELGVGVLEFARNNLPRARNGSVK